MSDDRHPYNVTFSHDRKLPKIDHSKKQPGPKGKRANRAGFTRIRAKPDMDIVWINGAKRGRTGRCRSTPRRSTSTSG